MENGNQAPEVKLDAGPATSLDFDQLWFVVREKAWLILLCGLLGIFGGLAYIYHTPLTYYAQASIEVDANPVAPPGYNDVEQPEKDPIGEDMAQTLLAGYRSRQFAQEVIEKYQLLENPEFLPPAANGQPHKLDDAVGALLGMERVGTVPGTRFINVGVMHADPAMAKELANMLASHIIEMSGSNESEKADEMISNLREQAKKASADLTKAETDLNEYIKKTKAVSLVESQDTVLTDLRSKNGVLTTARAELIRLEADDEESQKHKDDPKALLEIASVANDPSILQYKQTIAELKAKIQVLALRYTDLHPKMIQANTQLADAQSGLDKAVLNIPALIHSKRIAAESRVTKYDSVVQDQEGQALKLDDDRIQYDVLSRNIETSRAAYDGVLNRLKELNVATSMSGTRMHIFEPATIPAEPLQARKSKTMVVSLIGGLILGLVLSFGLHMMDSSVKTVDQAEDVLGLTVLAAIPRQNPSRLRESSLALVKAPGSPVAEAFRSLRTSIFLAGKAKGRKIVLFTSSLAGEGKTFCSTNYATSLAQQGLSTLLIDADLRSPMIRTVMLNDRKLAGLGELLSRKTNPTSSIHESEIENLWIMPAGDLLQNPAEVLASTNFGEILHQLGEKFERIVIDTAPVTAVSDTLLLLEHAQAICLVTHAGKTPRKWILRALKLIGKAGSRPVGVILNQMPMGMAGVYSYYPGKYGEPEVYGSANGSYGEPAPKEEPELAETKPRS